MRKYFLLIITYIGVLSLFSSCEKDEDKATLLSNPTAPVIASVPSDLVLKRGDAGKTLQFVITKANFGFQSSVTYILEADSAGKQFSNPINIASSRVDTFKISVSDLNTALMRVLPTDVTSSVELRVRALLTVESSGADPIESVSGAKLVSITPYGLPRLDVMGNTAVFGKVESLLGDGKYVGYVKFTEPTTFTLKDPDANVTYGANGEALAVNGTAISAAGGYQRIEVDTKANTYSIRPYQIGVVGAFTNWGSNPDKSMEYDSKNGYWYTTVFLPTGPMKFRLNSDWGTNWGPGSTQDLPSNGKLDLPNSSGDINITSAGNYLIKVTINGTTGTSTFTKIN